MFCLKKKKKRKEMIYQIESDIGYTNQKAFIELSELNKSTNRIPIEIEKYEL